MKSIYKLLLFIFCFSSSFLIQHLTVKKSWLHWSLSLRILQRFLFFESLTLSERELQQSKMCTVSTVMKNQTLISLDITHSFFNFSLKTSDLSNILLTMNNIFEQYIDCISQFKKKERWLTELIYVSQLTDCLWDSSSLFISIIIYTALKTWEVSERVKFWFSQSSYIWDSLWTVSCNLRSLFLQISLHAVFVMWENTRESHWNSFMSSNSWTVSKKSRTHLYWLIYTLSQRFEKSVRDSSVKIAHS